MDLAAIAETEWRTQRGQAHESGVCLLWEVLTGGECMTAWLAGWQWVTSGHSGGWNPSQLEGHERHDLAS